MFVIVLALFFDFLANQEKNTDYKLVKSLKKGDLFSFDQLFLKYSKKLYYFAKGYLGSKEDAEGLVQEVFLMVWNKRKELKEHLSFNAFLYTVTYNAIRKYFRKKAREKKYLDKFLEDYAGNYNKTVADIEYHNLQELANKTIEKLPQKRKLIFQLSRYEGLTNMEISKRLHISKNKKQLIRQAETSRTPFFILHYQ